MRRALRWLALALAAALLAAAGGLAWILHDRPSLERYADLTVRDRSVSAAPDRLTVTFMGVSTLLFSDGKTSVLTDGFFSRPGLLRVALLGVEAKPERIAWALERAGVGELAAVMPVHSHYDHAMDSPEVARHTGAVLLGSESTANVGRGWGLPESQIVVAQPGRPYRFGDFTLTLVPSRHIDVGSNAATLGATIDSPLVPPVHAMAYAEGVSWSIHVAHPLGNALVQGSAGFVEGALESYRADAVFLGVGLLGRTDVAYRQRYVAAVVEAVGARRVFPIHWDDFTLPLDQPLRLMPRLLDDVPAAIEFLRARSALAPRFAVQLLPVFEPVTLFEAARAPDA